MARRGHLLHDALARNAGPIREQIARASTGNVYWMFLLEGATRDPRVAAAALSVEQDISGITPATISLLLIHLKKGGFKGFRSPAEESQAA